MCVLPPAILLFHCFHFRSKRLRKIVVYEPNFVEIANEPFEQKLKKLCFWCRTTSYIFSLSHLLFVEQLWCIFFHFANQTSTGGHKGRTVNHTSIIYAVTVWLPLSLLFASFVNWRLYICRFYISVSYGSCESHSSNFNTRSVHDMTSVTREFCSDIRRCYQAVACYKLFTFTPWVGWNKITCEAPQQILCLLMDSLILLSSVFPYRIFMCALDI